VTAHRHRVRLPRDAQFTRAARLVLLAAQLAILAGVAGQLTALWTGLAIPRWALTADLILIAGFCLEAMTASPPDPAVLTDGRPRT
jgi:hypothetical protein